MFLPMGGIFIFGDGGSPTARLIIGIFNLAFGAVMLWIGFAYAFVLLQILGGITAALGALMILSNLFKLRGPRKDAFDPTPDTFVDRNS
jgi:hypothetical protein